MLGTIASRYTELGWRVILNPSGSEAAKSSSLKETIFSKFWIDK